MGKLKALLLAGAVAFGAVGSVRAADLPPPPAFEPVAPEPVDFGGWYLRGDVGVGIASRPDIRSSFDTAVPDTRFNQQSLDDAAFVGIGAGYQFNHWLRFDATGEYRTAQHLGATESYNAGADNACLVNFSGCLPGSRAYDLYSGSVQSTVALVNGYIDLPGFLGLSPFVGAGIGGSFNRVYGLNDVGAGGPGGYGNGGFGFARARSGMDLAYAGHAGVSYAVTPNLRLELAYRYLNMGDVRSGAIECVNGSCPHEIQKYKLEAQDIKLGMRWMFSDVAYAPPPPPAPAPYYPPPPLVRKY